MAAGKGISPIVEAIKKAEFGTTGEIQVHLSKAFFEKDPYLKAQKIFFSYGMDKTRFRNGVLLYLNLRKKKFALFGDEGIHHVVGQTFWERLARDLKDSLQSTFSEVAIADAVLKIGAALKEHFPVDTGDLNPNEIPDTVTES